MCGGRSTRRRNLSGHERRLIGAHARVDKGIDHRISVAPNPRGYRGIVPPRTLRLGNFEVEMGTACPARLARVAKKLARFNALAGGHHHLRKMQILGLPAALVRKHDVVCICRVPRIASSDLAVPSSNANQPVEGRDDGYPFRHSEVPRPRIVLQMTAGLVSLRYRVGATTAEGHCDIRRLMRRCGR